VRVRAANELKALGAAALLLLEGFWGHVSTFYISAIQSANCRRRGDRFSMLTIETGGPPPLRY